MTDHLMIYWKPQLRLRSSIVFQRECAISHTKLKIPWPAAKRHEQLMLGNTNNPLSDQTTDRSGSKKPANVKEIAKNTISNS